MTIYRERLWASAWAFISTALVIPAAYLVFLPINVLVGVVLAIALYAGVVVFLIVMSPIVEVTGTQLTAGRATVPLEFVGAVTGYRTDEATLQRGRLLDARAWLMVRGWISPVVKIELTDSEDPTPYWIVSTRRPEAFIAAITTAKNRL